MTRAMIIGMFLAISVGWFIPFFVIYPLAVPVLGDASPRQAAVGEMAIKVAWWPVRMIPPKAWDRFGRHFGLGALVAAMNLFGPVLGWGLTGAAIGAGACAISRRRREGCQASGVRRDDGRT